MIEKNDWRLQGQESYLRGITLQRKPYSPYREGWEHDHCEFCWTKLAKPNTPNALHEGYTTEDEYRWICPSCFEDFKEMFEWGIIVDETAVVVE